jgi:hypothetical protein
MHLVTPKAGDKCELPFKYACHATFKDAVTNAENAVICRNRGIKTKMSAIIKSH